MRVELESLSGKTVKFEATREKQSKTAIEMKDGSFIRPTCLKNVKNAITKKVLTDHSWAKSVELYDVPYGSTLTFIGTVEPYTKKYNGEIITDYHIVNIENVKIIKRR